MIVRHPSGSTPVAASPSIDPPPASSGPPLGVDGDSRFVGPALSELPHAGRSAVTAIHPATRWRERACMTTLLARAGRPSGRFWRTGASATTPKLETKLIPASRGDLASSKIFVSSHHAEPFEPPRRYFS